MSARSLLLIPILLVSSAYTQPDKGKKELAELQGVWRLIGFEVDGKEAYIVEARQPHWQIKDDKVYYGGEVLAMLALDPGATPKCIDFDFSASKRLREGIYQLDKDRLKICVGIMADGVKERPVRFDNMGIDKFRTMLFVRAKAGAELDGVPGFVGVQLSVNDDTKEIQVVDTIKASPAQKAGLKKDDVILKIGNDAASTLQETVDLVRQIRPGTETVLRIRRAGKEQDVKLKVGVGPFVYLD